MGHREEVLTLKQREALEMVADHLSSKEIAQRLGISPHSVDKRLDEARRRLGAATRKEAVRKFGEQYEPVRNGERFTGEPFTVCENDAITEDCGDERKDSLYTFADVGYVQPAPPWSSMITAVPEIVPERLGLGAKLGIVLIGALGMVVLALLLLALAQGLEALALAQR